VPAAGTRAATLEKRRLRYVAAFVGQLSGQAAACQYLIMWGVGTYSTMAETLYVLIRFDDGVGQWGKKAREIEADVKAVRSGRIARATP
jgi:hypothetical protein